MFFTEHFHRTMVRVRQVNRWLQQVTHGVSVESVVEEDVPHALAESRCGVAQPRRCGPPRCRPTPAARVHLRPDDADDSECQRPAASARAEGRTRTLIASDAALAPSAIHAPNENPAAHNGRPADME